MALIQPQTQGEVRRREERRGRREEEKRPFFFYLLQGCLYQPGK